MSKKANPTLFGRLKRPHDGPTTNTRTFVRCPICDYKYCIEQDGKECPDCKGLKFTSNPSATPEKKEIKTVEPRKNSILFREF